MTSDDFPSPQNLRPAARDMLAAAGPVEPSSSPGLAPGPTLSYPVSLESAERVPTLAFIPGIVITGRYRMRMPSQ